MFQTEESEPSESEVKAIERGKKRFICEVEKNQTQCLIITHLTLRSQAD
jgi:hypothetical protein